MNTTAASAKTTQLKTWTVQDYYRMSKVGVLKPDERTELIDGKIFLRAAKKSTTFSDYQNSRRLS